MPNTSDLAGRAAGIARLRALYLAGIALANGVAKSLEDGKVNLSDLPNLIPVATALPGAVSAALQYQDVRAELGDISAEERAELAQLIRDEISFPERFGNAEALVETIGGFLDDLATAVVGLVETLQPKQS
jgi:hypothetical protein